MTTSQTTTKEILVLAHRFSSCANDLPITLVLESCSGKSFVDIVFWLIAPSKSINNYFAAICSHVWFPDRQAHEFCCFDEVFSIKNTCFIILDFTSIFFCVYQILVSGCFSQTPAGNTKTSCTAEVVWANSWLCRTSQGPRRSFGTMFFFVKPRTILWLEWGTWPISSEHGFLSKPASFPFFKVHSKFDSW